MDTAPPPAFFDTHAHLHGAQYADDRKDVLARSGAAGVGHICLIGVDVEDSWRALRLAREGADLGASAGAGGGAPRLWVAAGVHPHQAGEGWSEAAAEELEQRLAREPEVCALGEMGLDYHYDFAPREAQEAAFIGQLEIARRCGLPVVIHCREAYEDCLRLLEVHVAAAGRRPPATGCEGVLHCWLGTRAEAQRARDAGFVLGIGGAATFKNAAELHRVIEETPLDAFVLETDAPYMTPTPYRGRRNEPAYVPLIAARVAELKSVSVEEVALVTTATAQRLYNLAG